MSISLTQLLSLGKTVFSFLNRVIKKIQVESVTIDKNNCSWNSFDDVPYAFFAERDKNKSPIPILSFSIINHTEKTILLTSIELKAKHLYSGLSGIPQATLLKSLMKYQIKLPSENETTKLYTDDVVVGANQAFKFEVVLYSGTRDEIFDVVGRTVLFSTFKFNRKISVKAPKIFLNTKDESETIPLYLAT